jgi:hypothetical protein
MNLASAAEGFSDADRIDRGRLAPGIEIDGLRAGSV